MIQQNNDPVMDHFVLPSQLPQLPLHSHYDALYRSLRMPGDDIRMPQAVGVTSSETGEGVSTVAINLAMSAARVVGRTLLVDANLDSPSLAKQFNVAPGSGLSEVMAGETRLTDCARRSQVPGLFVLTTGERDKFIAKSDPVTLTKLIDTMKQEFDFIVLDLPIAHELTVCFALAGQLDGVLLVVEAERVSVDLVQRTKQQLLRVHANVLGVVFNKESD